MQYPALIDGEPGAYGVTFPDLPGIVAMGGTVAEAMSNAVAALRDYLFETERDGLPLTLPSAMAAVAVPAGSSLISAAAARANPTLT